MDISRYVIYFTYSFIVCMYWGRGLLCRKDDVAIILLLYWRAWLKKCHFCNKKITLYVLQYWHLFHPQKIMTSYFISFILIVLLYITNVIKIEVQWQGKFLDFWCRLLLNICRPMYCFSVYFLQILSIRVKCLATIILSVSGAWPKGPGPPPPRNWKAKKKKKKGHQSKY